MATVTVTVFSGLTSQQNAQGGINGASMPNAVVNTGMPVDAARATLSVVPSSGYAEACVMGSFDGMNWIGAQEVYVAPGGTGTQTAAARFPAHKFITAVLMKVSPGAAASLTVTY